MKTDHTIHELADASLNSLEGVQRATPSPFLYTRILGRLSNSEQPNFWEKFSAVITRPAVAFACMLLIVMMNIIAIYSNSQPAGSGDQNEVAATDEFTQVSPAFYDLENNKP